MSIFQNFYEYFSTPIAERGIADILPGIIVAVMIFASGTVVYIQTIKAHFVTKKLINIVSNKATVIRDGRLHKKDWGIKI
ncbi:hypothetical protein [Spiroplasma phoeniceum]|uniref:Mg(2+) transport ATPase, P-type n=1 Tax=Spiroplasma phoeniceum P40 TaxID=1276259 RepID=A0A345DP30_9MOLU|nr:hypothetical protein [Spiroplasma phoeniceum]AXF95968.1 Mg(2+) transport ATPase, P-type [Spiroplasma phoeniceum P40]